MSDIRRRGFRLRLILDGVEGFRKKCYFFVNVYRDKYVRHVLQRIWSCFYSQLCSSADELWLSLDDFLVPPGETSLVLKEDDTVRVCLRRPSASSPEPGQIRTEVAPLVEAPGTMETSVALLLRRLRGGSAPEDSAEAERRRLRQVAELMAADSDSSDASTEVGIAEAASPAHRLNRLAGVDRVNEKLEPPRQPPAPPRERAHDISGTSLAELGRELKRRYEAARQSSQPAETSTPRAEPAPLMDVTDGDCAVEEMEATAEAPVAEATPQETAAPAGDVTSDGGELREAVPGRETVATDESSAVGEAVGTAGEGAAGLEVTSATPAETPQRRKGQKRSMSSSSSSEEGPDSDTDYSAAKVKKPASKPSPASASTARPQSDKPAGDVDSEVVQVIEDAAADADGTATTDPASAETKKKKTRTRRHRGKKKRTPEVPLLPPPPRVPQLRHNDYAQRHGLPKAEIERYKRAGSVPIGWQTRPKNRKMRFDDDGNMIVDDAGQEGGSDAGYDTLQQRLQRYASGPGENRSRGVRWAAEPEGRWRWGRGHGEQDGGASGHVTGVEGTGATPAQRHNLRESDSGQSPQRWGVNTLGAGEAPQSGAGTGHNSGPGAPGGVGYRSARPPWRYTGDSEPDPGSYSSPGDPSVRPYARVPPPGQPDRSGSQSTPGRAALGAGLLPRAFMRPRHCVNPPRRSEVLAEGRRDAASGRSPDCGEEAVSEARPERSPLVPEGGAGPNLTAPAPTPSPRPAAEPRLSASAGGGDTGPAQVAGSAVGSSSPLRPSPDGQPPGGTAPAASQTPAETVSNSAAAEEEHSSHQLHVAAAEADRSDLSPQCYRSTKNQRKHAVAIPPCAAPGRQRAVVTLSDGTGGAAVADVRGPDVRALLQQRRSRPLVVTRPVRPPPRGPAYGEVTRSPQPVLSGGEQRGAAALADSREDGEEEAAADDVSPSAAEGAAEVRTEDSPSSVTGDVYNNVSVVLSAPSSFSVPPPRALLSPAKNDSSSDDDDGDTDEESDYAGSDASDKYSTMRPSVTVGEKMQRRTGRPSWDGITNCNVVNEVGQSRRLEKQRAKALAGDDSGESGHPAGRSDVKDDKFYSQFPTMKEKPQPRDIIAFKCLELDDSYCPHVTEYKEASVQEVSHCGLLTLQLIGYRPTARRRGRFELASRDDDEIVDLDEEAGLVEKSWSELIQPRLLHP